MAGIYDFEPPTKGKVVLFTSHGDIDVELWSKEAPKACRNFIQLCMEGYYDDTIFHRIIKDFMIQGGDPTGTGSGGESIWGGYFEDEVHGRLKFSHRGLLAMANENKKCTNGSQFFITLDECKHLNKKHTIFGKVVGKTIFNVLEMSKEEVQDDRPVYPPKITGTKILINPFDDIVPRITKKHASAKTADEEEDDYEKEQQKKRLRKKNKKLLSFDDESDDDVPVFKKKKVGSVFEARGGNVSKNTEIFEDDEFGRRQKTRQRNAELSAAERTREKLRGRRDDDDDDDRDERSRHSHRHDKHERSRRSNDRDRDSSRRRRSRSRSRERSSRHRDSRKDESKREDKEKPLEVDETKEKRDFNKEMKAKILEKRRRLEMIKKGELKIDSESEEEEPKELTKEEKKKLRKQRRDRKLAAKIEAELRSRKGHGKSKVGMKEEDLLTPLQRRRQEFINKKKFESKDQHRNNTLAALEVFRAKVIDERRNEAKEEETVAAHDEGVYADVPKPDERKSIEEESDDEDEDQNAWMRARLKFAVHVDEMKDENMVVIDDANGAPVEKIDKSQRAAGLL
eukprot:TRINITY_DN330_c3_g1_i1.p1 TRINITY_DN330_c3_g1~~TRINITY_DN330_c3_g1_i1.p1  ORF type:complete len:569 (+),score=231.05 TRINITY_DN330_c3_g1_i1:161-1867(+)